MSSNIPLKIAKQVDGVLRHYWGKPRTEDGAKQQIRNLSLWIRWALKEGWSSSEIINFVKLSAFSNCIAWSPKQIATGKPQVYWTHQAKVARVVRDGLMELGREDVDRLPCV